ncbi:MAG: NAD(P)-dependent oxidoreductase [Sphingobium sp.]
MTTDLTAPSSDATAAERATRCGFIGLGSQGAPIARRMIDAGFPTMLWARRSESLAPYEGGSATFASTVAELGASCDHVGLCVVNDDDVRQVCAELIPAMRPGSRIAIHSTIHPNTCRAIAEEALNEGIAVIDAPVSGGSPAAEAGTLTLMLGGDPEIIEAALPVFRSFGRLIVRLGDVGAGQHAKLINNTLLAANIGLADRALEAGEQLDLDRAALIELLLASSGRSMGVEVRGRMAHPTAFAHGASLLKKDMNLLGAVIGEKTDAFQTFRAAGADFLRRALGE